MAKRLKTERLRFRRLVQIFFAAMSNSFVTGFAAGKIYKGNLKQLCAPGLNCYSCPGALLACPIGSLQAVIGSSGFQISLYVFGFITLFGALLGRAVCGFLCPFGLVQEWIYKIPFPLKKNSFRGNKILQKLKFIILALFVIILPMTLNDASGNAPPAFCKWVCPAGTLEAGIPLVGRSESKAAQTAGANKMIEAQKTDAAIPKEKTSLLGGKLNVKAAVIQRYKTGTLFWWKIALLLLVLILSLMNYRPFCKYICPLGAMYGLMNPVSLYRLRFNKDLCIRCGKCKKACKMCIDPMEQQNSVECVRCGDCVNACPTNALSMGLGKNKRWINLDAAQVCSRKGI